MNATPATVTVVESAWGPVVCSTGPTISAEQFQAMLDKEINAYAAKGRQWIEAKAAHLKERIAFQRRSKTNYDMGALIECMEGQMERLRKAWKRAK